MDHETETAVCILAGGLSRRMGGGDKALADIDGRPMLAHVIARLRRQTAGPMLLNANGDPARFQSFGLPVAADVIQGHQGPLAGILTGLTWLADHHPDVRWMVSAPADAPFLPTDLIARLTDAAKSAGTELACALSGGRAHPVVGLWPVALRDDLRRAMLEEDIRKIDRWTARHPLTTVSWPADPLDPFININTPDDLAHARACQRDSAE